MNTEQLLVNKEYYKNFTEESSSHPIEILGELYLKENENEIADFSYIRFAQGEVYFHHKDYEAAIFKWENIDNEFASWAKKNIADAYLELGQPETAEGIYLTIEPGSPTLEIETNLQLLTIYIEQGNQARATAVINDAVALDPDYPEVTEIARNLFEENRDWNEAIQLAVNEAIRTGDLHWYTVLKSYIDQKYTIEKEPSYFNEVLQGLFSIDQRKFEQLVVSLWTSYKGTERYHRWIENFNSLFLRMGATRTISWLELPQLYQDAYFELINGTRLIKEISSLIPDHLTNWINIANHATSLFASSSVMSWNEMFPMSLPDETVREAEKLILTAQKYPKAKEDSLELFQNLAKWSKENGFELGNMVKWKVEELANQQNDYLLLAGMEDSGKAELINRVLGEELMVEPTSSVVIFKDGPEAEVYEITDTEKTEITTEEQFQEAIAVRRQNHLHPTLIDFKSPKELLKANHISLIDIPSITGNQLDYHPIHTYVHFADRLLFILNASKPLTDQERGILKKISIQAPKLPVHFVLNQLEFLSDEQEAQQVVEKTRARVREFFPNAEIFTFNGSVEKFSSFIASIFTNRNQDRVAKLQYFVGRAIHYLLDKRIEKENSLIETVRWNEDMVTKLKGAINQVHDLEDEKKKSIKGAFENAKNNIRSKMIAEIPEILKGSAELLTEESDFAKIHLQLNEEMNTRVQAYLEDKVLNKFYQSLQNWIVFAKEEFDQAQFTLEEMSAGFNAMYGDERIIQECDFKVLDDWRRDADRMTSGVHFEDFNFFLRFTPAQFLLKSAGKLLSVLPKNNAILYNKYKSYLENEDYHDTAVKITDRFFKQFEMFEKSISRDVKIFFRSSLQNLNGAVEEAHGQIESSEKELKKMRVNPEVYRDPLNLFEVRLRQYEWMAAAGKEDH